MAEPMSDEELATLKALCRKATAEPWWPVCGPDAHTRHIGCEQNPPGRIASDVQENDADFIAAARSALPRLLAEVARLKAELDTAKALVIQAGARRMLDIDAYRQLKAEHDAEIAEFNAGYEAAKSGIPYENEPPDTKHDVWRAGWAWFAFDGLLAEVERLRDAGNWAVWLLETEDILKHLDPQWGDPALIVRYLREVGCENPHKREAADT